MHAVDIAEPTSKPKRYYDPHDKLQDRSWRNYRWIFRSIYGAKLLPDQDQIEAFHPRFYNSDPLADDVADWISEVSPARGFALLGRVLDHDIDSVNRPPAALKKLFAELDRKPAWVNPSRLRLASDTSARCGMGAYMSLRNLALMGGYQNAAIAKPLARTGALNYDASRRIAETGNWWADAMDLNGLERFQPGFKACVRVRIMHALVRRRLMQDPNWDTEAWGLPINQADMIATNLVFSVGFLTGSRVFGFRFTDREAGAIMHMWRYIGFLMGVDSDFLPEDPQQGSRLLSAYVLGSPPADDDSRSLAAALMQEPYDPRKNLPEKLMAPVLARVNRGMTRLVLGDHIADELGLPDTWLKFTPLLMAPTIYAVETARMYNPLLHQLFVRGGRRVRKTGIRIMLGGKPASYRPTFRRK